MESDVLTAYFKTQQLADKIWCQVIDTLYDRSSNCNCLFSTNRMGNMWGTCCVSIFNIIFHLSGIVVKSIFNLYFNRFLAQHSSNIDYLGMDWLFSLSMEVYFSETKLYLADYMPNWGSRDCVFIIFSFIPQFYWYIATYIFRIFLWNMYQVTLKHRHLSCLGDRTYGYDLSRIFRAYRLSRVTYSMGQWETM